MPFLVKNATKQEFKTLLTSALSKIRTALVMSVPDGRCRVADLQDNHPEAANVCWRKATIIAPSSMDKTVKHRFSLVLWAALPLICVAAIRQPYSHIDAMASR